MTYTRTQISDVTENMSFIIHKWSREVDGGVISALCAVLDALHS